MSIRFEAVEVVCLDVPDAPVPIHGYLECTDGLVRAIANPDLTEKLTTERYRFKMEPIGFLDIYQFQPIVTLKIWCDRHYTVHIKSIDYQLQGLEAFMEGFHLTLNGTLKPVLKEEQLVLQGRADLTVKLPLPLPLRFTPKPLLQMTGDRLLGEVLQHIKQQILKQLIHDYQLWANQQTPILPKD